ncbi:MAG: aspartyl/glutamyl-tRNA amidotransferase subunit A [Candidatus Parvarchaeota archaeon]|nr:aspartyl/glutamyl-tRNA amidotransferase subunit A [Candidatus Parvarchaeota archaeon]
MRYIEEFFGKEKSSGYYNELLEDLEKLNINFGAFNFINKHISTGFPMSVKDNICVKGMETTASSKILKGYIPPFSATVINRLEKEGFSVLGKTNMDEFGFGSFGINSETPAKNPFDETRVAGGSSSGAAIATAILKYHVAVAESTGGSIAAPASFCGVVGFTPTYGLISRYGLIDYANSLDKIGFMSRSSEDIHTLIEKTIGKDPADSTSVDAALKNYDKHKLIIVDELYSKIDKNIKASFDNTVKKLSAAGFKIEHLSIPEIDYSIPVYYIISMAEASTNLAKFTGFKYGLKVDDFSKEYNDFFTEAREAFGEEAKRKILLGTFIRGASVRSKYYEKALKIRRIIKDKMSSFLKDSFIISPTMPVVAPTIKEAQSFTPIQNYSMDLLTIPPNLCGFPTISLPSDYLNGLPVGIQITGGQFEDMSLVSFGEKWEKTFKYNFKYNLGEL